MCDPLLYNYDFKVSFTSFIISRLYYSTKCLIIPTNFISRTIRVQQVIQKKGSFGNQ